METLKSGDKFPGLENVLEYLPHPGRLFLTYFDYFNEVFLRPQIYQGLNSNYIGLLIFRGEEQLFEGNYGNKLPRMCLHELEPRLEEFKILPSHKGMSLPRVQEKEREYLRNKLQKIIDGSKGNGNQYVLLISPDDAGRLRDEYLFSHYFWEGEHRMKGGSANTPNKSQLGVFVRKEGPWFKGLQLGKPGSQILSDWEKLIPDSPYFRHLSDVIRWYRNWSIMIPKMIERGIKVDLTTTWSKCQRELMGVEK